MPQKPVGTRVLPTADWFAGSTAMAGGLARGATGQGIQLSLFNDAPAGQYLWLWWISVFNDAEGTFLLSSFEGSQGTKIQQGAYVTVGRGAAFGAVFVLPLASAGFDFPPPGTEIGSLGASGLEDGSSQNFNPPGPLSVIPPGFSFAVGNNFITGSVAAGTLAITFYYSILPYIPDK